MGGRDISGLIFGRLTALRFSHYKVETPQWLFRCSCGTEKRIAKSSVTTGLTRSCGCLHMERCRSGLNHLKHGQARNGQVSRLHNLWRRIIRRVDAKVWHEHRYYSSRGIGICEAWRDFKNFDEWAKSTGYDGTLTIERIDNKKGYAPDNCKWATRKEQARNRSSSRYLTAFGKTRLLIEWAEEYGIKYGTLRRRIDVGVKPEDAILKPVQ